MTHLSSHTWLDGEYIYTTSAEVAAAWWKHGGQPWFDNQIDPGYEYRPTAGTYLSARQWRLPRSAAREVYSYREGEPFCHEYVSGGFVGNNEAYARRWFDWPGETPLLHLRSVIPCNGSAESLRVLGEWIG